MMTGTSGRAAARLRQHFEPAHAGHVDVGEDQDQRRVLGRGGAFRAPRPRYCANSMAKRAERHFAPELLAEQIGDVGLVVDDENQRAHWTAPGLAGAPCAARGSWMVNSRKGARLGRDLDRAAVLFHDDVVAERKAEPRAFAGRLGGEERVEHLRLHLVGNAGSVVADRDLDAVAEVARRGASASAR